MNVFSAAASRTNKVLRDTFLLLGMSLIPTLAGIFMALASDLPKIMIDSPWLSFIGFLGIGWGLLALISATATSFLGIVFFFVFTWVMGGLMSAGIDATLQLPQGGMILAQAVGLTIASCFGLTLYAMTTSRDFSSLGGFLFGSLVALIAGGFLFMFMPIPAVMLGWSVLAALLFSAFLVYDVQRIVDGGETNYILAATGIYLDIANIFMNILSILGYSPTDD